MCWLFLFFDCFLSYWITVSLTLSSFFFSDLFSPDRRWEATQSSPASAVGCRRKVRRSGATRNRFAAFSAASRCNPPTLMSWCRSCRLVSTKPCRWRRRRWTWCRGWTSEQGVGRFLNFYHKSWKFRPTMNWFYWRECRRLLDQNFGNEESFDDRWKRIRNTQLCVSTCTQDAKSCCKTNWCSEGVILRPQPRPQWLLLPMKMPNVRFFNL